MQGGKRINNHGGHGWRGERGERGFQGALGTYKIHGSPATTRNKLYLVVQFMVPMHGCEGGGCGGHILAHMHNSMEDARGGRWIWVRGRVRVYRRLQRLGRR